jgi:hypothetical protein
LPSLQAGSGGNNRFGSGGGAAGTLSITASAGVDGGGGGGAYANFSSPIAIRQGAAGGMEVIWTDSFTGQFAGPGGGGGGSRGGVTGGSGGNYGGGSGSMNGFTGSGLVVITANPQFPWDNVDDSQGSMWTPVSTNTTPWSPVVI